MGEKLGSRESVGNSPVCIPDSSDELKLFGELFLCGLGSLDSCSTKSISESIELIEVLEAILKLLKK